MSIKLSTDPAMPWTLTQRVMITLALVGLIACAPAPITQTPSGSTAAVAASDAVQQAPSTEISNRDPLPVPSNLVPLTQPTGQKRLMQSHDKQSFWPLTAHFETQKSQTYCSVATSTMVLNALGIQRPKSTLYPDFPYFTQEDFFRAVDPQLADPVKVSRQGMTFDQLSSVLARFPITVQKHRASDLTLTQFRELIRTTVSRNDKFVLLNFKRTTIGQVGGGHWSPVAAFDGASDSVLLLDVARYKYPPVWVPTSQLYRAALEVDNDSGLARGVLVVGKGGGGANRKG